MPNRFKETFLFAWKFVTNPFVNASLVPSSKSAARGMLIGIDFSRVGTVIELGPGTGIFTEEIVRRCRPETKIIAIELDPAYVRVLREKFGGRISVENESAHRLSEILTRLGINKVDLIVSGLPFLPASEKDLLLQALLELIQRGAIFRFFTYMPFVAKKIYKALPIHKVAFVLKNFPPMWVYETRTAELESESNRSASA